MGEKWPPFHVATVTPELVKALVKQIKAGSTPNGAARLEGVPVARLKRWRKTGTEQIEAAYEANDPVLMLEPEAILELAVQQATAELAQKLGRRVKVGGDDWRAKAWMLERLEREDFSASETIDVTVGGSGVPIAVEGRAVVGIGDVVGFLREVGLGHLVDGVGGGDARGELPAASVVLPDPAGSVEAASGVPVPAD